jgi:hypothetical protein
MSYKEQSIGSIGVDDEGSFGQKTGITIKVDTLEKATIRFGNSYTLRINEEDLDELRRLFHDASRQLCHIRVVNEQFRQYNSVVGVK